MFRPPRASPAAVAALLCASFLVACDEDGTNCDASAAYSVTVSVFDGAGDPYAPDEVTYSVDGSAEAPCEAISDGTEFLCGIEEIGTFDIRIFVNGAEAARETVDVDLGFDGCHVASEFIDVTV